MHPGDSFVFIGAGPAALALADQLTLAFPDRSLVLIDDTPPEADERTYAFWSDRPTPYDRSVYAQWDAVALYAPDGRRVVPTLGTATYRAFDMGTWRSEMRRRLEASGARWFEDHVTSVDEDGAGLWVQREGGPPLQARWGFDSRYDSHSAPRSVVQSFKGWWLRTAADRFTAGATLMDFRLPCSEGVRFWYVLPASPRRALVMAVTFAHRPIEPELAPYARLAGLLDADIERVEAGTLPMRPGPWERRIGDRMLRIGLAGGRLKASTGYGLTRFVSDAEAITASFQEHGHPFELPEEPRRAHWMDAVFLRAMSDHPDEAPDWFVSLFEHVPIDRLLRFLDGHGTPADHAFVARALPLGRFLPYLR